MTTETTAATAALRIFHLQPGSGCRELQTLPQAPPAQGFYWIACTREALAEHLAPVQACLQAVTGASLLDLHVSDLLNVQRPSGYDYTAQYDLLVLRRLAQAQAGAGFAQVVAADPYHRPGLQAAGVAAGEDLHHGAGRVEGRHGAGHLLRRAIVVDLDAEGLLGRRGGRHPRVAELLADVGLADWGHAYPKQLSGGMAQRVALGKRMDFDTEVMVRLYWQGNTSYFIPTRVTYPQDGLSHFDALKDNVRISLMHTRLFFGMLPRMPDRKSVV